MTLNLRSLLEETGSAQVRAGARGGNLVGRRPLELLRAGRTSLQHRG